VNKVGAGTPLLPSSEDEEHAKSDHHHGDESGTRVLRAAVLSQTEGQQEYNPRAHKQESADYIELVDIVNDRLHLGPAAVERLPDAHLNSLPLVELEDTGQWQEDGRLDNAEHSVAPAPTGVVVDVLGCQRTGKRSANKRRRGKCKRKRTRAKTSCIRHKDIQNQIHAVVADPVQHVTSGKAIRAIACGQNDHAEDVHGSREHQGLGAAPEVESLSQRQLKHTTNNRGQDIGSGDLWGGVEAGVYVVDEGAADGRM